jgi:hypothetical protein
MIKHYSTIILSELFHCQKTEGIDLIVDVFIAPER